MNNNVIHPFEKELTRLFGPPKARQAKRRRAIRKLLSTTPEETVRRILTALSRVRGFIPARSLREVDLETVPLKEVLRPYDIPWFTIRSVGTNERGELEVEVSHGIPLAARGEVFCLVDGEKGLSVKGRWTIWMS